MEVRTIEVTSPNVGRVGEVELTHDAPDKEKEFGIWAWHIHDEGSMTLWMNRTTFKAVVAAANELLGEG